MGRHLTILGVLCSLVAAGCGEDSDDEGTALEPGRGFELERVRGAVEVDPLRTGAFTLEGARRVPDGTRVNATRGAVEVTAALPGGGEQTARMSAGQFSLRNRRGGALTEITLRGRTCGRPSRSTRETRKLFGDGEGSFTTRGRFGAAGVRGTRWGVRDRCDGTLIVAREGTVIAEDFVTGRRVTLRAPQRYLARAR